MPPIPSAVEETLAKIKQVSIEVGDNFRIKIYRKRTMTNLPDNIATLDGATLAHIASPEVWMGRLAGGGTYQISAYRLDDPSLPIGGPIIFSINSPAEPKDVDPAVLKQPGWQGPPVCVFPEPSERGPSPAYSVGSPVANPHVHAPQTIVPGGTPPGSQLLHANGPSAAEAMLRAQLEQMQARFYESERRADDDRRKAELERIRADSEARLREMQMQMDASVKRLEAAQSNAAAAPKNGSNLAEILTAVGPLVTQMLTQQSKAAETQMTILTALLSKPAIDPALQAILLERNNGKSENIEMLNAMPAMMTSMSKMAMTVAEAVSELSGPPEPKEAPGVAIAREISKAVQTIGLGLSAQAKAKQAPQQPALPPGSYEARAAQLPPSAQPNQAFAGPPQPTNGKHPHALEEPVQQPKGPRLIVDEVERMIRAKYPPLQAVKLLIENIQNDQVQQELIAADGDFQEMFARRLVDFWPIEENQSYLVDLFTTFQTEGDKAGIFEDEGPVVEGETVDSQAEA